MLLHPTKISFQDTLEERIKKPRDDLPKSGGRWIFAKTCSEIDPIRLRCYMVRAIMVILRSSLEETQTNIQLLLPASASRNEHVFSSHMCTMILPNRCHDR